MDGEDAGDGEEGSSVWYYYGPFPAWKEQEEKSSLKGKNNSQVFSAANTTLAFVPDIHELNQRKLASYFPLFIILGTIVVLGLLCNIVVCYIYRCRSRRATSNFFVIFFAILDMCGCAVTIPLEMSVLALPYTYDILFLCKIIGFVEAFSVCALCTTLVVVGYDSYRKLCASNDEFGVKKARTMSAVSVMVAGLLSIPALAVFGIKEIRTSDPRVLGKTCFLDPDMPGWLSVFYYTCVLAAFFVSFCVMLVMYLLIGVRVWKQRQAEERGDLPSPSKREFPKKHRFVREDTSTSSGLNYNEEICRLHSQGNLSHSSSAHADPARGPFKSTKSNTSSLIKSNTSGLIKSNSLQANSVPASVAIVQLHVKTKRQACIFVVISVTFAVTMLPFVVVTILHASTDVFNQFSSTASEIVFNLCVRSYLLNYLVKPVVYVVFNLNFRKEVKHLFNKVWTLCTSSSSEQASARKLERSHTMGTSRSVSRTPIYRPPLNSA